MNIYEDKIGVRKSRGLNTPFSDRFLSPLPALTTIVEEKENFAPKGTPVPEPSIHSIKLREKVNRRGALNDVTHLFPKLLELGHDDLKDCESHQQKDRVKALTEKTLSTQQLKTTRVPASMQLLKLR